MNTILRLFYDLTVYQNIIHQRFVQTLLRFFLAYLILAIGYSLYISKQRAPEIINTTQAILTSIINATPPEATFTISDYRLSTTNFPLPFTANTYLYLDPTTEIPPTNSNAIVAVGASVIRLRSASNTYEAISFRELELNDVWITGQQLLNQLRFISQKITQLAPYIPLILTIPIYLGLIITRILQAIFYALIFLLGVSLTKGHYRFKEIVKITFHSIIVAEVLNLAILVVYNNTYPTIFSTAFIGISILAYLNLPARLKF